MWRVTLFANSTLSIDQWTALTDGSINVEGGSFSFSALTDIDGSSLYASGGGSLILPMVTSDVDPNAYGYMSIEVGQPSYYYDATPGTISMPLLTLIDSYYVDIVVEDSGSLLNVPDLTSITLTGYGYLTVVDQGSVAGGISLRSTALM